MGILSGDPASSPAARPVLPSSYKAAVVLSPFPGSSVGHAPPGWAAAPVLEARSICALELLAARAGPSDSVAQGMAVTHMCQNCLRCI